MALLIEEEEDDSAIESDDEPNQMERKIKRTLSRLHSHSFSLARADSVQSRSSHRTSLLMESQLSVLTSETEISIFVSLWLETFRETQCFTIFLSCARNCLIFSLF